MTIDDRASVSVSRVSHTCPQRMYEMIYLNELAKIADGAYFERGAIARNGSDIPVAGDPNRPEA